jgi:translation initiation factor IF-3
MDYGKWKYEQDVRGREARKRQSHVVVKEMRYRPKISIHDFDFKTKAVERFLRAGFKVKITIWFRGREIAHPELGTKLLDRLAAALSEVAVVEVPGRMDGRNMVMVMAPIRKQQTKSQKPEGNGSAQ